MEMSSQRETKSKQTGAAASPDTKRRRLHTSQQDSAPQSFASPSPFQDGFEPTATPWRGQTGGDWFELAFGFRERHMSYEAIQQQFKIQGPNLVSQANGHVYRIGEFSTPTLAELRQRALRSLAEFRHPDVFYQDIEIEHATTQDVFLLHSKPAAKKSTFQVASQFNCLEFAHPEAVPEDGVTIYAHDHTQGPSCSLAAGAATVYRNYLLPRPNGDDGRVSGEIGQTTSHQVNNLLSLEQAIGNSQHNYFQVYHGYTFSNQGNLKALRSLPEMTMSEERHKLRDMIRVGVHDDVEVVFDGSSPRWRLSRTPNIVTQVFCSAISVAYSGLSADDWEPLATMVLEAQYEACLWAAVLNAVRHGYEDQSSTVYLTFVGGGVFGNPMSWIAQAIGRACAICRKSGLKVKVLHYRRIDVDTKQAIDQAVIDAFKREPIDMYL